MPGAVDSRRTLTHQRSRGFAFTLVVCCHLLLLTQWQSLDYRKITHPETGRQPAILWLPPSETSTVRESIPIRQKLIAQASGTQPRKPDSLSISPAAPAVSPAPTPLTTESAPNSTVPDAIVREAAPSTPLNLTLPFSASAPWRTRNPAVELQIGRNSHKGLESQIASALSSDKWTEERIDNDRIRFRSGNKCLDFQRPREQVLDASRSSSGSPWMTAGPKPC
jgi:hypothetical protein